MRFTVMGEPIAKARPRITKTGHAYTPARTKNYEKRIQEAWREQSGEKLDGPLRVKINAYFKIPKSTKKAVQEKMLSGEIRPTKKPDLDNLIKQLDALNGLAFDDDKQIIEIEAHKYYGEARLEIELWKII